MSGGLHYYRLVNREPVPVLDMEDLALCFEEPRHVADEWIGGLIRVSTVFLGFDHRVGDGPPLLFETMIFDDVDAAGLFDFQARSSTWAEAEVTHAQAVALVEVKLAIAKNLLPVARP